LQHFYNDITQYIAHNIIYTTWPEYNTQL